MSATLTLPVHSITPSFHQSYSSQSLSQISTQSASISKPSFIEYGNYRFVIVDAPTDSTIDQYLACFKKKHVVAVARCCEPTYSIEPLTAANLKVIDIPYPDGDAPPRDVIDRFLSLVYEVFGPPVKSARTSSFEKDSARKNEDSPTGAESTKPAIAIHCVAGLGRAPCLVAIALMEHGIGAHAAIDLVRKKRRGAINAKQLAFLERYTPAPRGEACCTIM